MVFFLLLYKVCLCLYRCCSHPSIVCSCASVACSCTLCFWFLYIVFFSCSIVVCSCAGVVCSYTGVVCSCTGVVCSYTGVVCSYTGVICSCTGAAQGIVTGVRSLCNGLGPACFGCIFYLFHINLSESDSPVEQRPLDNSSRFDGVFTVRFGSGRALIALSACVNPLAWYHLTLMSLCDLHTYQLMVDSMVTLPYDYQTCGQCQTVIDYGHTYVDG